jgi:serine/threonine protein kinase
MTPEQAEDARSADIRADVYSLGCTLYYLLTGSISYPASTSLLKILAHRERPLPAIRQARPEVPPELARVVARMMAKKPGERSQTPGGVATRMTSGRLASRYIPSASAAVWARPVRSRWRTGSLSSSGRIDSCSGTSYSRKLLGLTTVVPDAWRPEKP